MTIAEAPFVLADTETSGTDEAADLLEIAARRFGAPDAFETLVRPTKPIPPEASCIHHLVDADFVGAPDAAAALDALAAFVGDAIVVCHNASFDQPRLPSLAANRFLCSERLAHHLAPDAPNFKLGTLYYFLGGPKIVTALHRAASDLDPLAFVFDRLLDRYRAFAAETCAGDAARLAKSEQVDSLLAFAARPYAMLVPPFGKYKTWDALFADAGYLRWMRGLPDLSPDLRWNLEREARRRSAAA